MDTILRGIPHCICYFDNILVTGRTNDKNLSNLETILSRLQQLLGARLQRDKCRLLQESVNYLGHTIDAEGVHTCKEKVNAIVEAPSPTNLQELWSILGLLNYYVKFLSNLATVLHPLTSECESAFQQAK